MNHKIVRLKTVLALIAAAFIIGGCMKENMDGCGIFRLQFSYTYNNHGQDRLAAHVRDIRIYVFNRSTNLLAEVICVSQQDIARGYVDVELPAGVYTLTAWAGSGDDLMQGGYHDANMTNSAAHIYTPQATIGKVTLDNFRMMLAYNHLAVDMRGDITPKVEQFDDLFFAIAHNVSISKNKAQTVDFDFIKNTSILKVKVTGLEYLTRASVSTSPLNLFVIACNGRYQYDNTIDGHARELRYEPSGTFTTTAMQSDIKALRLDIERHAADPVLLYIQRPETGFDMLAPLNVVDAILQIKNERGGYVYKTQEDIDREDEFLFEISILHDLSVHVTVNGFEIVDVIPNIKRP